MCDAETFKLLAAPVEMPDMMSALAVSLRGYDLFRGGAQRAVVRYAVLWGERARTA